MRTLSIDDKTKYSNVTFKLAKNYKIEPDFLEGNCCWTWHRLVAKYELHRAPSYLHVKNRMVSIDEDANKWITECETLRFQIDDTRFSSPMTKMV